MASREEWQIVHHVDSDRVTHTRCGMEFTKQMRRTRSWSAYWPNVTCQSCKEASRGDE